MCQFQSLFPWFLLHGSFPSPWCFFIHMCWLVFCWGPEGDPPQVSGALSVYSFLLFGTLPCELQLSQPFRTPSSVSSIHGDHWALPRLPIPAPWPGNSLQPASWDNRGLASCVSPLSGALPSAAWCPVSESGCFVYFVCFSSCFRRESKSGSRIVWRQRKPLSVIVVLCTASPWFL